MPNIITPNGDGINDYHIPLESSSEDVQYIMSRIKSITYSVRNRWGVLIHFSEGELPSWNGNDYKSGNAASQGTYFWVLSYEDASGGNFKLNGFVDLSR
jgi:gliding motility-associated-like protein